MELNTSNFKNKFNFIAFVYKKCFSDKGCKQKHNQTYLFGLQLNFSYKSLYKTKKKYL